MSYEIRLHPKAASFLDRCNQATKEQLKSKIRVLENHPKLKRSGADIKKIRDANPEAYRLRIGDYRNNASTKRLSLALIFLLLCSHVPRTSATLTHVCNLKPADPPKFYSGGSAGAAHPF